MRRRNRSAAFVAILTALGSWLLGMPTAAAVVPGNDDIANATVITALPFTDSLDTTDATTAPDDPQCEGNAHTVWYSFTPATDVSIAPNTFGSDYDTTLSAYTGFPGALTQIACNDDFLGLQSRIRFDAAAGTTYFIMVGSFDETEGGDLVLSVGATPAKLRPATASLSFEDSFVDEGTCAFDIAGSFEVRVRFIVFFDEKGDPAKTITHVNFEATLENLVTGTILIEQESLTEFEDFEANTFTVVGLPIRFRAPDGRFIIRNAGKVVFDEDDNIIFEGGPHPELHFGFDICEALA
ncbi:MAG: hypothetical protein ACRDHS_10465 [Actinomycetota bacterium]